jgi:hypothetical protein
MIPSFLACPGQLETWLNLEVLMLGRLSSMMNPIPS